MLKESIGPKSGDRFWENPMLRSKSIGPKVGAAVLEQIPCSIKELERAGEIAAREICYEGRPATAIWIAHEH